MSYDISKENNNYLRRKINLTTERVLKWLGMVCLLAGITRMGMTPTSIIWGTDSVPELTFGFIACVLMSVSTIVTYLVQSKETGVLGFIASMAMIVGNIVTTCMLWTVFVLGEAPEVENILLTISSIISMVGLMLGTLLFLILTFRAKVFPWWVSGLLLLMLLSIALPFEEWFAFFWGLAYVGLGYTIWAGKLNKVGSIPKARSEISA
jgi:hypothetical protein